MSDINVQIVQASNYRAVDSIIHDMSEVFQKCTKGGRTLIPDDFFMDLYRMVVKLRNDNEALQKKHNDDLIALVEAQELAKRITLPACCLDCKRINQPEER